ncbi:MAG: hypothetical protein F4023_05435 [Acidobacteria bacterium]|nr:hypothetical protein [Acidobacteriota bacterium]MYK79078.1 hypothetical protein [Acidobacteriota bacterium]
MFLPSPNTLAETRPHGPRALPNRIRTFALCLPLGLLAACGGGTDGTPVAPTPAPAPSPAPPPATEPPSGRPTLRALVWGFSAPSAPTGYAAGEMIVVVATFQQTTTVRGNPRLGIQIGEHLRLADFSPWVEDDFPPERPSFNQRFAYEVTRDDTDADGISVSADAFDFSEGTLLNDAGVEIAVEIYAVAPKHNAPGPVGPGEALDTHPVMGTPEPRACTNERTYAANFSKFVLEWEGTPFRVDMIDNFPDHVIEADLLDLLDAVGLLADKIEDQLGYRILEMGDIVPVPAGMPPGWNEDEQRFRRTCPLPREEGQIHIFYMDDVNHGSAEADGQANCDSSFSFLQPFLTYWPCRGCEDERTPPPYNHFVDGVTHHEIFHVLGYIHTEDYEPGKTTVGVPMSWTLRGAQAPEADAVLFADIDLLRCIFPAGG